MEAPSLHLMKRKANKSVTPTIGLRIHKIFVSFFCLTHRSSISYVTFVSLLIVSYTSLLLHLYSSHRFHIHRFPSLLSGVDFDENFPEGTHALTVVPTTEDKIMISTIVIP